jgi:hypothetical protein
MQRGAEPPALRWIEFTTENPVSDLNISRASGWVRKDITFRLQAKSEVNKVYRDQYFIGEAEDGWYLGSQVGHVLGPPKGPLPSEAAAKQEAQGAEAAMKRARDR